nr:hypothetical protein [Methanobrevibacter arboriphilus]
MPSKTREDFQQIYTVELDNKDLIELINQLSTEEIYSEVVSELEDLNIRYEDVADELAMTIAEKLQSNVKQYITTNGSIALGLMFHSVDIVENDVRSVMVEETAESEEGYFYPAVIEDGRDPIEAPDGGVLAFYPTGGFGEIVFAKKVAGVPAKPFWEPAVIQTEAEINLIVEQELANV